MGSQFGGIDWLMIWPMIVLFPISFTQSSQFVLGDGKATWDSAQKHCLSTFGTNLASIHDEEQYEEVKTLCASSGDDCWIGLHRLGKEWHWSDDTAFDFGTDVSGGKYPWWKGNPS